MILLLFGALNLAAQSFTEVTALRIHLDGRAALILFAAPADWSLEKSADLRRWSRIESGRKGAQCIRVPLDAPQTFFRLASVGSSECGRDDRGGEHHKKPKKGKKPKNKK